MKYLSNRLIAKLVLGFLLRFILIYGLFIILWFNWGEFYAEFFRESGNRLFGSYGSQGIVRFRPYQPTNNRSVSDTKVIIANRATNQKTLNIKGHLFTQSKSINMSSRHVGYASTVLLLTLILATPIAWKRKGWVLLWGMILIHVFIVLRLTIGLLFLFSHNFQLAVISFSPFWHNVLRVSSEIFIIHLEMNYIVPITLWILVTFRRSDWQILVHKLQANIHKNDE